MLHLLSFKPASKKKTASLGSTSNIKIESINEAGEKKTSILFTFGMSGKFEFTPADELEKHSHLMFFTKSNPQMVLSFVDYRRFGKWFQGKNWSTVERGPCVIQESSSFIQNIADNIENCAFNKPICEVLLNQKFFSGIGNYLRAEILYRCGIPPFQPANEAIKLKECYANVKKEPFDTSIKPDTNKKGQKAERGKDLSLKRKLPMNGTDIDVGKVIKTEIKVENKNESELNANGILELQNYDSPKSELLNMFEDKSQELLGLCHSVPLEVVVLGSSKNSLSEMYYDESNGSFNQWLQCYSQPGMKNLVDHNKRTIWFTGKPGSMAPRDQKTRVPLSKKNKSSGKKKGALNDHDYEKKPKVNLVGPKKKVKVEKANKSLTSQKAEAVATPKKAKRSSKLNEQEADSKLTNNESHRRVTRGSLKKKAAKK